MSYTRLNPASVSVTSGLFTPASGITVESQSFTSYGKIAFLDLQVKHSNAWTVGSQYNIGTVSSAYRPSQNAFGMAGSYGGAALLTNGSAYVRPLYATETAAGAATYVRFVYMLP